MKTMLNVGDLPIRGLTIAETDKYREYKFKIKTAKQKHANKKRYLRKMWLMDNAEKIINSSVCVIAGMCIWYILCTFVK